MSEFGKVKVWFSDGTTKTVAGPAQAAELPKLGWVCVNQEYNGARRTMYGHDYYFWINDEMCGGDYPGMMQYLMNAPGKVIVYFGQNMYTPHFMRIVSHAQRDPEFPTATARRVA